MRFGFLTRFSILELGFGKVIVAGWADPFSVVNAAEGWLVAVRAEFFVHLEQLRSFL